MSTTHPTNAEVNKAFEVWRQKLIQSGFTQTANVYYRLGEYDLGPTVTKTGHDVRLLKEDAYNGRKYWQLFLDVAPEESRQLVNNAEWRLYGLVLDVDTLAFFTNKEAYDWFTSKS